MDTYRCVTASPCCAPKTNTSLINDTNKKQIFFKNEKKIKETLRKQVWLIPAAIYCISYILILKTLILSRV